MGTAIIGLQWGDEGKGKVCDALAHDFDVVVRYQGGPNSGHTVVYNGKEIVLHHIPSGIFQDNVICVIGNGCVLDLSVLLEEIEQIEKLGVNTKGRIFISERAHIILPYHREEDEKIEKALKIGTTMRGVGPSYRDKYARFGLRMVDLEDKDRIKEVIKAKTRNSRKIMNYFSRYYDEFAHLIIDTVSLLNYFNNSGKRILFEGAQGVMLDIDFGTYPFVTSSNPSIGGIFSGTGLPITAVDTIIGIMKPYTTRVGNGPFPTEIKGKIAKKIREKGNEFGATTGRERRIGWLDLTQIKYACLVNGVTEIFLTKVDVLSGFEKIKISTNYILGGEKLNMFPANISFFDKIEVEYIEMPGWGSLKEADTYFKVPDELKVFVRYISNEIGIPIRMISSGKERKNVLIVD